MHQPQKMLRKSIQPIIQPGEPAREEKKAFRDEKYWKTACNHVRLGREVDYSSILVESSTGILFLAK